MSAFVVDFMFPLVRFDEMTIRTVGIRKERDSELQGNE